MLTSARKFLNTLTALITLATFSLLPIVAWSQTPTQAQIEQFKRLSPEEQRALAESMGIDVSQYVSGGSAASQNIKETDKITGDRRAALQEQRRTTSNRKDNSDKIEAIGGEGTDDLSLDEDREGGATADKLRLFGYDIFDFGGEAFTPATDIPIPSDYIVGPGDTVVVQLYGKENNNYTLTLDRQGQIQFPNIGPVSLAGLTYKDMEKRIEEIVSEQMIGVKSSITMGALRTIRIFVLGEAQIPGSYVVGSLSTMTNAIFASGGITKIGSLRNIQLKRNGKIVTTLDLYDLLLEGDTSKDSRLLPGDVIFIPPIGKTVGVSGQVKRPAIYELTSEKSVNEAIEIAGGLLPTAYVPASRIERITDKGEKTLVNLDLSTEKGRNFKVQDADVIQIFSTLDTMRDIVKLDGHVKRPGGFAWRENIRFTDIVPDADSLLPNPDITVGLIQREQQVTRKIEVHLFSPEKAFADPGSADDPKLSPRDTITLFEYNSDRSALLQDLIDKLKIQSNIDQRQQTVRVFGSVRFPGEYPLATSGMTIHDLINLAGGLTESAQDTDAEITRYDLTENRQRVALRLTVDLQQENPLLKAADTLRVKQIPQWRQRESINVLGEVNHPGVYDILPGETLLDVLERAGGLTHHAYPKGAIFSREELRELERDRLEDLKAQIQADIAAANIEGSSTRGNIDNEDTQSILRNIESTNALGRMVIDLSAILQEPSKFDFELTDGDRLLIPRFKPSVTVVGEIQHPTSHFFNDKLNVQDYIELSGGTSENADKKRIYVVKANGSVYTPTSSAWFRARSESLAPGDTIIVPIDTDKVDTLTMWSSITSILGQSAAFISVITR